MSATAPATPYHRLQAQLRAQPRSWLITGVAGFLGSHLLQTLLQLDQHVVGLDNFSTGHHRNLDAIQALVPPLQWGRFDFIEGDIRDLPDCHRACQHADHVLHLAALDSPQRSQADPIHCNDINVTGFLNMLVAARDCRVQSFTYAASSAAYGDHPGLPQVESTTGPALSAYGVSKTTNELYAQVFARTYGFASTGLRYFNLFGPRQDPSSDHAAVLPLWTEALLHGAPVCINGDGETSRDFCFVANAVQATLLAAVAQDTQNPPRTQTRLAARPLEAPAAAAEPAHSPVYNVGAGERTTLNALFALLRQQLAPHGVDPHTQPVYRGFRPHDMRHSLADLHRAQHQLGYQPTHTLLQGLLETLPPAPPPA